MALNVDDLLPGDLVLCYGWNGVGKLQAAVKTLGRLGTIATVGASVGAKLALGDAVPVFSGSANCNHALVIGEPLFEPYEDKDVVRVCASDVSCTYKLDPLPNPTAILKQKGSAEPERISIRNFVADRTDKNPTLVVRSFKKAAKLTVFLVFKKQSTRALRRICHATGGGCVYDDLREYFGTHSGGLKVYRMVGADDLAPRVAQVAARWANETRDAIGEGHYSKWKAFTSAFRSHIYGPGAKARAKFYYDHGGDLGGPPSSNNEKAATGKKKEWFCSMFAIACFQAALYKNEAGHEHENIEKWMPLDARTSTPMTLDGFLAGSSNWRHIGTVP
jgi:hypothetical protein